MKDLGKWGIVACIALALSWASSLHAQSEGPSTVVKINPLSLFVQTINLKAERKLTKRFSAELGLFYGSPRLAVRADSLPHGIKYKYFGLTPQLRFYINFEKRPNPKGLYIAMHGRYVHVREQYASYAYDPEQLSPVTALAVLRRNVATIGFAVGYQLLLRGHFAIDGYLGPQYNATQTRRTALCPTCDGNELLIGRPGLPWDGMDIRAGLTLGYAF